MATKKKLLQAAAGNASSGYKYLLATASSAARGMLLYDISDPTSPSLLEHNTTYYSTYPGDYDYVHDRMHILQASTNYSFTFNTGSIADVSTGYSTSGQGCIVDGANGVLISTIPNGSAASIYAYNLDANGKRTASTYLDFEQNAYVLRGFTLDPTNEIFMYGCADGNRIRTVDYSTPTALGADTDYTASLTESGADDNRGLWIDPTYGYVYSYSDDDSVLYSQGPYPAATGVDTVSVTGVNSATADLSGTAMNSLFFARDGSMAVFLDSASTNDKLKFVPITRASGTFGTVTEFTMADNYGSVYAFMNIDEERSLVFVGRTSPTDRIEIYDYSDLSSISLVGTMDCQTDSGQTAFSFTNIALAKE